MVVTPASVLPVVVAGSEFMEAATYSAKVWLPAKVRAYEQSDVREPGLHGSAALRTVGSVHSHHGLVLLFAS